VTSDPRRDLVVTLDVGTTAVKAAVWDPTLAAPLALVRDEYGLLLDGQTVEVDPTTYLEAIARTLPRALGDYAPRVRALAFASQGETMILVDRTGVPVSRAIVWLDARAEAEAEILRDRLGDRHRETGIPHITAELPLAKAMRLTTDHPGVIDAGGRILLLEDYLVATLTGRVVTTPAHQTSTGWFDLGTDDYDDAALAAAGVTREALPPLVEPGTPIGPVRPEWATVLGLPDDVLVVAGAMDQTAAALGAGALQPGVAAVSLGTALVAAVSTDALPDARDDRPRLTVYRHTEPGRYLVLEFLPTGAALIAWLRRIVGGDLDYPALDALAAAIPAGSDGVIALPTFEGALASDSDAPATGALLGLTTATTTGHLVRALMEAVAFALRDVLDGLAASGLDPAELRLAGGGALSRVWPQLVADVCERPFTRLAHGEAASAGAALLACWGSGLLPAGHDPRALAGTALVPDPAPQATYAHARRRANAATEALAPWWRDADPAPASADPEGIR
jgi:xylulokinase